MMTRRAYRYELKPNNRQRSLLLKHAGCARFAYNWGLARRIDEYQRTGRSSNAVEQHREINALKPTEFPWMYEVSKCAPQEALRDLDKAYQQFFRRVHKGEKPGFPRFKKKGRNDSFRLTGWIEVLAREIQLPRLGRIRSKEETSVEGKILSATVRRLADRWFVSLTVEEEMADPVRGGGDIVGVDRGLKRLAQVSDGSVFEAPKPLRFYIGRLRRLSKAHSRKRKGSNNRRKSAMKLARLHYRIRSIRVDFLHKVTSVLAKTKSAICVESLDVQGMIKNPRLARSIQDVGWDEFVRQLEYKCCWYGSVLIQAPANYPSSKKCSSCGHVKGTLALSERLFHCERCGIERDRDENAAKNLQKYALSTLSSRGIQAYGEDVRPAPLEAVSMK